MKIKCPVCGEENYFTGLEDEDAKFCSNCNTPLGKPVRINKKLLNANRRNQKPNCNAYDKAEEAANKAWQKVKEAAKKSDTSALKQTMSDYCKAMEPVMKIWPKVVDELGIEVTSATEIAYLSGYSEAVEGFGLPKKLAYLRGDHVAAKTLYKVSRWIPFK